jgi:hypothetical protein
MSEYCTNICLGQHPRDRPWWTSVMTTRKVRGLALARNKSLVKSPLSCVCELSDVSDVSDIEETESDASEVMFPYAMNRIKSIDDDIEKDLGYTLKLREIEVKGPKIPDSISKKATEMIEKIIDETMETMETIAEREKDEKEYVIIEENIENIEEPENL